MLLVFISSPYTIGDKQENVDRQREMAHILADYGYCPVPPLVLGHYLEQWRSRPEDEYIAWDIALLAKCDAVLRLEGESVGADLETKYARHLGIPVCYSVEELSRIIGA